MECTVVEYVDSKILLCVDLKKQNYITYTIMKTSGCSITLSTDNPRWFDDFDRPYEIETVVIAGYRYGAGENSFYWSYYSLCNTGMSRASSL